MPWFSYLLNLIYLGLILLVSPVLVYRAIAHGKYRDGFAQKFLGAVPHRNSELDCLWLHAVSVGEVLQLRPVLQRLEVSHPNCQFVISTTTQTGFAVASEKYPQHQVCYFPLDFTWAVNRAIQRIKPTAIVLVELELWPNFILAAAKRHVPLMLINGRVSENSFRGYRRIRPLIQNLLKKFDRLAMQNETYAGRIEALGADCQKNSVTGSIKYDGLKTDRNSDAVCKLRRAFGLADSETVFIAGSTQHPEEEIVLDVYLKLQQQFPDLRLILVPRHQERFEEVARLVTDKGLTLNRRSQPEVELKQPNNDGWQDQTIGMAMNIPPVGLLDTLGELSDCWGLADIAFVGGSLTKRGGQNMMEPAAYGAAVLFGPNTQNFRDVVESLLANDAARVVHDANELTEQLRTLLNDSQQAGLLGLRAQQFVLSQQGATEKTAELISELLPAEQQQKNSRAA